MPRKNVCFSSCRGLTRKICKKNANCNSIRAYSRNGYKTTKNYCRLGRKFIMHRNARTKKCSVRNRFK